MLDCSETKNKFETALSVYTADVESKIAAERGKFEGEAKQKEEEARNSFAEFKFEVTWDITSILVPVIEVTMKEQRWSLDLPQVTMKDRNIIFHTPSIRMVTKKVGQKPEVYCEDTWIRIGGLKTKGIPKCTVRWTDIFADIPEPFMEEQKINMKIPEFVFDTTDMILHVPEFTTSQKEIKLHLPHFKLIEAYINRSDDEQRAKEIEEDMVAMSNDMKRRIEKIREEEKSEFIIPMNEYFTCLVDNMKISKTSMLASIDVALGQLQSTLQVLESRGAGQSQDSINIRNQIDGLKNKHNEQAMYFDAQIEILLNQERQIADNLAASST